MEHGEGSDELVPRQRNWERTREQEAPIDPFAQSLDSMKIGKDNKLELRGDDDRHHEGRRPRHRERGGRRPPRDYDRRRPPRDFDRRPHYDQRGGPPPRDGGLRAGPVYDQDYQYDRMNRRDGGDRRRGGRFDHRGPPPPHYRDRRPPPHHHHQHRRVYSSKYDKMRSKAIEASGVAYIPKHEVHHSWFENQAKIENIKGSHPYPNDKHLLQNKNPERIETFTVENRKLNDDAPQKTYYSRKARGELISVNHWGQRKLMMSEIEFLTEYSDPNEKTKVVYAGAAPGLHTKFLAKLFPNIHFILVDPSPFGIEEIPGHIEIRQTHMTKELSNEFLLEPNVLLISDIRTVGPKSMDAYKHEQSIQSDNNLQLEWHLSMKPQYSMFKFRCPYYDAAQHMDKEDRMYKYIDGEIYLPVWGPQSTTETRLIIPRDASMKEYDIQKYEQQMFYFNTKTRVDYYEHDVDAKGLDHCYDCRAEIYILSSYVKKFHPDWLELDTKEAMENLFLTPDEIQKKNEAKEAAAAAAAAAKLQHEQNPFKNEKEEKEEEKEEPMIDATITDEQERWKTLMNIMINLISSECTIGKRTLEFTEPTRTWRTGRNESRYLRSVHSKAPKASDLKDFFSPTE